MGTRCNVIIKFGDTKIRLYRHWDGYPTMTGQDILNKLRQSELKHAQGRGIIDVARLVQLFLVQANDYRLEIAEAGDLEYVYEIDIQSEYQHAAHYNQGAMVSLTLFTRTSWEQKTSKNFEKEKFTSFGYHGDFQKFIDRMWQGMKKEGVA